MDIMHDWLELLSSQYWNVKILLFSVPVSMGNLYRKLHGSRSIIEKLHACLPNTRISPNTSAIFH